MAEVLGGLKVLDGNPYLLGSTLTPEGCNFALFSKNAVLVKLLLFKDYRDSKPESIINLDPKKNKTGDIWHVFVHGIKNGQYYGYSVDGPYDPAGAGHRFNPNKLLIDPYTRAVSGKSHWNDSAAYGYEISSPDGDLSFSKQKNWDSEVKSIVVDDRYFDWEGDRPLNIPMSETVIYETHVRAFTIHPSSGVKHPGTYLGMIEKIPYLKDLGITTVELLPVHEFNEEENIRTSPVTREKLKNFWGYSTLAFFAPAAWYASDADGLCAVREFKEMVKAFHKAGIEVILDVVYNHTGEGNEFGPTLSFRGLDNSVYYMLDNGRHYKNYSGCGNTLNCNHVVVKNLIRDSLRYWVIDMHVDGFRFDLAAILGRDSEGKWVPDYSVLMEITQDPILSNTKIIAEGWDVGFFQVGGFPPGWAEWNAHYRDDVRSFIKSDSHKIQFFMNRLIGSPDLFSSKTRAPFNSINFIAAHDGFTLNDIVSYNNKHNEANGESNTDGNGDNKSWNCGAEGDTDNSEILVLRDRQMKNLTAVLLLSQGTPMLLSGDEMKFSKKGNNNSYCQDNEVNWLDWSLLKKNHSFYEFCQYMIQFRLKHPSLLRRSYFNTKDNSSDGLPDISWHGIKPNEPSLEATSLSIAFLLNGDLEETGAMKDDANIYVAVNAFWKELSFQLPDATPGKAWHFCVDTGSDETFYPFGQEKKMVRPAVLLRPRSVAVLIEK